MNESQVGRFLADRCAVNRDDLQVTLRALAGGLECSVRRADVRLARQGGVVPASVVIKELRGRNRRELRVYALIDRLIDRAPVPRVLGFELGVDVDYLLMEEVRPFALWPWADVRAAAAVCRELARLHRSPAVCDTLADWNYEQELTHSAEETLEVVLSLRSAGGPAHWRRVGDLRRVVQALPRMRERLLSGRTSLIHGDVHPGNVVILDGERHQVVLIDWGRARVGSPFEDVASWLQSLGCWEPQAVRLHDTLLRAYLAAAGESITLGSAVREQYWLAGACNGLAGAIRYHLWRLNHPEADEREKWDAAKALDSWQRIVRRAASLLKEPASR